MAVARRKGDGALHSGTQIKVRLFVISLVFRVLNALAIGTAFAPDEYWQSIEVAHRMVFG